MFRQNKLRLLIVVLAIMLVLPLIKIRTSEASSNLKIMTTSTGTELKYRNSSEKVYGLSEYDYPTSEYRAVWVSTFVGDIPAYSTEQKFKQDANQVLDNMEKMGMNAIVFHVRTHNNALYKSDLNPIANWWQSVNFDKFDPLTWLIEECHNRGIEFHAWMNPYRVNSGFLGEDYPSNHPCKNPELILTNSSGAQILDPGSEIVQDFIVDTCMEFLERYDADAIHFDDYFYISGVKESLPAQEKRNNVDAFIEKLSNAMHEMNIKEGRAVQLGISPSGIYQNGGYVASPSYDKDGTLISPVYSNTSGFAHYDNYLYSDTKKWIDNEWIDYITPQAYWGMEHTGANFFELTRWWSWCVKYKKVNLYMGIGVYMAQENTTSGKYWQKNPNEIQNQILNAGMYDEIKGICLYKYSCLLDRENIILKNGVDLITNDYWNKRIPGVVIPRYATTLPSVKISGLKLDGAVLSWNKVDNVFGYMVYQVPKGETLNTKNINHVLVYTQDTFVNVSDTLNYDYYVSSVNRANVISDPTQYSLSNTNLYEQVIAQINSLPTNITLDNEELVIAIRAQYNSLNSEDKNKVTNYNNLVKAEETITKLKALKAKVETFLENVDTHINTDRILPTGPNMSWSYKNLNDANSYNITNGKRLKNYIADYVITLYLELTENELTYKQEVEINLSLLKKDETGLYYRNDPSSMSENHMGQYTNTTSFIGWSNATITVDKQVLFIAKDNYYKLTSNTINKCNWSSCAGVYYNSTDNNISMTLGQAFSTESPTYGYFVIGNNKQIKKVSENSANTQSVTLLPKETLVIIRYLDRIIDNTPFASLSNLTVGKTAYLTDYSESGVVTPQDEAQAVIELIDLIKTDISLEDEALIYSVKDAYDALSNEAKEYVTNYNRLTNAILVIERLKQELETLKQSTIVELNQHLDLSKYSVDNQQLIKQTIALAENNINNTNDSSEIIKIKNMTISELNQIKTLIDEAKEYYQIEREKFVSSIDLSSYSLTNQQNIENIISQMDKECLEIAELTNIKVDELIAKSRGQINQLPTYKDELENEIQKAKLDLTSYSEENKYSSTGQNQIDEILSNAFVELSNVKTIENIASIVTEYKQQIDKVITFDEEVAANRSDAIKELEDYINAIEDYHTNDEVKRLVDDEYSRIVEEINKETNKAKITKKVTDGKTAINHLVVVGYANYQYQISKGKINFDNYSQNMQKTINDLLATINSDITSEMTKENIDTKVVDVQTQISKLSTLADELKVKKEETKKYMNELSSNDLNEEQIKAYDDLLAEYTEKIDNATSESELSTLKGEINQKYESILAMRNSEKSNCSCKIATQVIMLITIALGCVIIRKKH